MTASRRFVPLVNFSKSVVLQRVQAAVGDGYRYYVTGTVEPEVAVGLARKFKALYAIDCDKNERYRRKKEGRGNARLVLTMNRDLGVDFFLLVTGGDHPARQLERLRDTWREPLTYNGLELVRLTLKGRSKPGWTWRLTAAAMQGWRERLHLATVQRNEAELRECWRSLYRTLGFAGVRRQVGELVSYWRKEWARYQGARPCPIEYPHDDMRYRARPGLTLDDRSRYWTCAGFPSPAQLPKLFYVRLQRNDGMPLTRLVAQLEAERQHALRYEAPCPS